MSIISYPWKRTRHLSFVRSTLVISVPPSATSLSLFSPGSGPRVNASNGAQLVEHFIHALQPDALTASAIALHHLLNAHCAAMSQIVSEHPLRHELIQAATSRVGHPRRGQPLQRTRCTPLARLSTTLCLACRRVVTTITAALGDTAH